MKKFHIFQSGYVNALNIMLINALNMQLIKSIVKLETRHGNQIS